METNVWLESKFIVERKFVSEKKSVSMSMFFSNAYKCAVFFEKLTPKRNLTWIGALPDALEKATNQEEVKDILGADVTRESFDDLPTCEGKTADARCYTIVSEQK